MPTNVSEEPIYQDTRRHIREDRHIDPTLSERHSHDEYQTYVRGGRVDSEGSLPAVRACVCVCVFNAKCNGKWSVALPALSEYRFTVIFLCIIVTMLCDAELYVYKAG